MGKIVNKESFGKIRKMLKQENKKIVLCHGVFDLVHIGHIIHFQDAKSQGDTLVVSVTAEKFVRKGPGRPYFNDEMRLKFLSSIEVIDYVILSEGYTAQDIIEMVEPDIYVKGSEYAVAEDDITGKIDEETELVHKHGGKIYFSSGEVFSSTKLINRSLPTLSAEAKEFIGNFKRKFSFTDIKESVEAFRNLKVLVIGDAIIDDYIYCKVQGIMSKDMGYSTRFKRSEQYLGGALAVGRHISTFCDNLTLMSAIGNEKNIHSRILNDLSDKMRLDLEYSDRFETIIKQRFITENDKRAELNKIFVINNLSDSMKIDEETLKRFKAKLKDKVSEYDLVIVCDFGHGLMDTEVLEIIQEQAKLLTVNCQTNSSNYGLNLITKYRRADAFTLDQKELKLAVGGDNSTLSEAEGLEILVGRLSAVGWLTCGSRGAIASNGKNVCSCPALTLNVVDTIGAGDAFYSLASLCMGIGAPIEIGTFMGNIAGALAANIPGNKESIDKVNVLKYASTLLNI